MEQWAPDPGPPLTLARKEVHVWRLSLNRPPAVVKEQLSALLAEDEKERAARFHFEVHRQRYIVARATLRTLLGRYLDAPPAAIRFGYSDFGKPSLASGCDDGSLQFNLAHSGSLALLAFARNRAIGVDVEERRPIPDALRIARRYFSEREVASLAEVPAAQQPEAFLNGWTRKEAYIKAIGEGLSHPLATFDVTLEPGVPAALLQVGGDAAAAEGWRLVALEPDPAYVAALIATGRDWHLRRWDIGSEEAASNLRI